MNAPHIPADVQERMDALVAAVGAGGAAWALAVSLERLAQAREHAGALTPLVHLRSAAQDLRELLVTV